MNNTGQLIRALKGPVILIVLGFLFLIDHSGGLDFSQTWPVLIILFGVIKLLERVLGRNEPPPVSPAPGAGVPPGYGGSGWPSQPPAAGPQDGGQGVNQ